MIGWPLDKSWYNTGIEHKQNSTFNTYSAIINSILGDFPAHSGPRIEGKIFSGEMNLDIHIDDGVSG